MSTDLSHLSVGERWTGLKAIGMVEAERHGQGKVSREQRDYITSLDEMELLAGVGFLVPDNRPPIERVGRMEEP